MQLCLFIATTTTDVEGFIDFVIAPYYTPLAQLLPEAQIAKWVLRSHLIYLLLLGPGVEWLHCCFVVADQHLPCRDACSNSKAILYDSLC